MTELEVIKDDNFNLGKSYLKVVLIYLGMALAISLILSRGNITPPVIYTFIIIILTFTISSLIFKPIHIIHLHLKGKYIKIKYKTLFGEKVLELKQAVVTSEFKLAIGNRSAPRLVITIAPYSGTNVKTLIQSAQGEWNLKEMMEVNEKIKNINNYLKH